MVDSYRSARCSSLYAFRLQLSIGDLIRTEKQGSYDRAGSVCLPDHLDGRTGSNRSTLGHAQIAAQTDIDALKAWLARFLDTRTTFDSYRKESERLLLWSTIELGKPLSSLTHEDLLVYQRFLAKLDTHSRASWTVGA